MRNTQNYTNNNILTLFFWHQCSRVCTYHRFFTQSTEDILLVSVEPPHLLQLGVHGRGVEAAAGGQHPPQRGLHPLRHADLAADVEVAAPPADSCIEDTRYILCVDIYLLCVSSLDPHVVNLGSIPD